MVDLSRDQSAAEDPDGLVVYIDEGMPPETVSFAETYTPPNTWWSDDVADQAAIVEWLAFAASWIRYGVFTARALLSYGGPYIGLETVSNETTLHEATIRGKKSLEILDIALAENDWLALGPHEPSISQYFLRQTGCPIS